MGEGILQENTLRLESGGTPATFGIRGAGLIEGNVVSALQSTGTTGSESPAGIVGSGTIRNNHITSLQAIAPGLSGISVQGFGAVVENNTIQSASGDAAGIRVEASYSRILDNHVNQTSDSLVLIGDGNYHASNVLRTPPHDQGAGNIAGTGSNANVILP